MHAAHLHTSVAGGGALGVHAIGVGIGETLPEAGGGGQYLGRGRVLVHPQNFPMAHRLGGRGFWRRKEGEDEQQSDRLHCKSHTPVKSTIQMNYVIR